MERKDLRIKEGLVLCENCDDPADWDLSIEQGWVGCAPCMTGEWQSFNPENLIVKERIDEFLKVMNEKARQKN